MRCKFPDRCELLHCIKNHHVGEGDQSCGECKSLGLCDLCGNGIHDSKTCEEAEQEGGGDVLLDVIEDEHMAGWYWDP